MQRSHQLLRKVFHHIQHHPTAYPIVLNWTSSSSSFTFNAPLRQGSNLIQTTPPDYGWRIYVPVGSAASRILGWQSVTVNGFRLETHNVTLNDDMILLVLKVTNSDIT
jgi:hypothetical protein